MTTYPTQPTGDNSLDLTNIFASNSTNKIIMSTEEILEGYNNDGETATPLTSTPDGNKFNYFWYQVHNTLAWIVGYIQALFDNKLELSGGTMTGNLALGANKATSTYIPTSNEDLTNKLYVDTAISGAMWLGEIKELSYPSIPTLPSGVEVVECNGRALSKTVYSTLYALIGTTYGGTEAGTTFNIPDKRGVVTRGWDHGRGLDTGRTFGSYQDDTIQNITGSFGADDRVTNMPATGAFYYANTLNTGSEGAASGTGVYFDASRIVRTSNETRMKNIAGYFVMRIK